jgi:hypothetical protein
MAVGLGEVTLVRLLDAATVDLLHSGVVNDLMVKYDFLPGRDYLPVAKPYQEAK